MDKPLLSVVYTLFPDEKGNAMPVVFKLHEAVPGDPGRIVIRMVCLDTHVLVFVMPVKGSELEKNVLAAAGTLCGWSIRIPMTHVRFTETMATAPQLKELIDNAEEIQMQLETPEPEEPEDPEDPEEDPEEEPEEEPVAAAPPMAPSIPFGMAPPALPSSAPNGQTGG